MKDQGKVDKLTSRQVNKAAPSLAAAFTFLLLASGCAEVSSFGGGLAPSAALQPFRYLDAIPAAEGDEVPLAIFDPPTMAPAGKFIPSEGPSAVSAPGENEYLQYASLAVQAGGFMPVKLSDMYHGGVFNYDATFTFRRYENPVRAGGAIERDEFLQHPGYLGAAVSSGQSAGNDMKRLVLSYAKSWERPGLYLVTDFGFARLDEGMSAALSQNVGIYYYTPNLPVRGGVVYEGRSSNYAEWPTGRWDGVRLVGEYYLYRMIVGVSYALTFDNEGDIENQFTFETQYFPFSDYYFTVGGEHNIYEGDWEYVTNIGVGYNYANRFTVEMDFNVRDASCAVDASFSGSLGVTYRY